MKYYFIVLASLLCQICCFAAISSPRISDQPALAELKKINAALATLQQISYTLNREFNYPSEGYHHQSSAKSYLDFTGHTPVTGFRFQFSTDKSALFYDGNEAFTLDKSKKTMEIMEQNDVRRFSSLSYLYYSIATLRNVLPGVIANDSITKTMLPDTLINKQSCYRVRFVLHKQIVNSLFAGLTTINKDFTYQYTLMADKATSLPVAFIQFNPDNKDLTQTNYTDINTHPSMPAELSWHSSAYAKTYQLDAPKAPPVLIKAGNTAPDWQLTPHDSHTALTLNQYKGKVVMLEFWFKNCGPCIESAPELNSLYAHYQHQNFQLLGLNIEDSREMIKVFQESIK